jgi:hypothetical protein
VVDGQVQPEVVSEGGTLGELGQLLALWVVFVLRLFGEHRDEHKEGERSEEVSGESSRRCPAPPPLSLTREPPRCFQMNGSPPGICTHDGGGELAEEGLAAEARDADVSGDGPACRGVA